MGQIILRDTVLERAIQPKRLGGDQALALRALAGQRASLLPVPRDAKTQCQTILITGGKGGVGRSVIALNLAIALSQHGKSVGLLDASPELSNIELLCGLNGYWSLPHVLQGCRQLDDVVLFGPADLKILSGGHCLASIESNRLLPNSITDSLQQFENGLDLLIVDGSSGSNYAARALAMAAEQVLIVATPEPTGIAEAYASVKSLASSGSRLGLIVNQADSEYQAQQILDRLQLAAHSFLGSDLSRRGWIPKDPAVSASVIERVPFVIQSPTSTAAIALQRICQPWLKARPAESASGFFTKLIGLASDNSVDGRNLSRSNEPAVFHEVFREEGPVTGFK
jgi:flagellar biosynthesis protein FlhG